MERGLVAFGPWDEAWDEEGQDRRACQGVFATPILSTGSFIVLFHRHRHGEYENSGSSGMRDLAAAELNDQVFWVVRVPLAVE